MRLRESAWLLIALALASAGTHAQQPTTLQCDLLFSSWILKPPARDMVSKDVHVNINPKTVTIEGSIAFDGTYVVSRRTKESISLDFPGRPGYLGVINRLGREISLVELANDGKTVKQIANGNCRSVKPPF
jgi:hypothetical protein